MWCHRQVKNITNKNIRIARLCLSYWINPYSSQYQSSKVIILRLSCLLRPLVCADPLSLKNSGKIVSASEPWSRDPALPTFALSDLLLIIAAFSAQAPSRQVRHLWRPSPLLSMLSRDSSEDEKGSFDTPPWCIREDIFVDGLAHLWGDSITGARDI